MVSDPNNGIDNIFQHGDSLGGWDEDYEMDDLQTVDASREPFTAADVFKHALVEINSPPQFAGEHL